MGGHTRVLLLHVAVRSGSLPRRRHAHATTPARRHAQTAVTCRHRSMRWFWLPSPPGVDGRLTDADPTHTAHYWGCGCAGHTKRVTAAVWGQDSLLVSASNDKSLRFWKHTPGTGETGSSVLDGSWECAAAATEHSAEVRGLALHPSRVYAVSVSADASWAWWDLAEAKCLKQVGALGGGSGGCDAVVSWGSGVGAAQCMLVVREGGVRVNAAFVCVVMRMRFWLDGVEWSE